MIGGNTKLILRKIDTDKEIFDENGKRVVQYINIKQLCGWLDLISGDSKYDGKAKIEDSTHVFICDYTELDEVDVEEIRATTKNMDFDVKYIDDPMGLHEQIEIYLKKLGGQNGKF